MKFSKTFSLLILLLIITAGFLTGVADYKMAIELFLNLKFEFLIIFIVYLICFVFAPLLGVAYCFGGKLWKSLFNVLAALAVSGGGIILIFPLKLTAGDIASSFLSVTLPAIIITTAVITGGILRHRKTVGQLIERGVNSKNIRRSIAIKSAYSTFLYNSEKAFSAIIALYMISDIIGNKSGMGYFFSVNNSLTLFLLILFVCAVVSLIGTLLYRLIER